MRRKAGISESFADVLLMQAGPAQPLHSWYSTPMSQAASLHYKDKGKGGGFGAGGCWRVVRKQEQTGEGGDADN